MPIRPLFVTRKFPPSVGGMETLAAGVWRTLKAAEPGAELVAHGGSNRALPLFVPRALGAVAWRLLRRRRTAFVLAGDALMYTLLWPLLAAGRVPNATMVMGLDLTYENRLYRAAVHRAVRRAPRVLAISEATAAVARDVGVAPDRLVVVRLGVHAPAASEADRRQARRGVRARLGVDPDAPLVATVGRLVRRKGTRWFVAEVLPQLPGSVHYAVAGEGEEREPTAAAARAAGLQDRVHLLGRVDDATRDELMTGADLFVQPNIPVAGDLEGFGLVTVEAAMRGALVVAADLEGIRDAVVPGRTGELLPPGDAGAWGRVLQELLSDPAALRARADRYRAATRHRYDEARMGAAIREAIAPQLEAAEGASRVVSGE